MSHDQRPSRVRVVTSTPVSTASSANLQAGDVVAASAPDLQPTASKGGIMLPSMAFCLGCALGGAAIGAVMLAH